MEMVKNHLHHNYAFPCQTLTGLIIMSKGIRYLFVRAADLSHPMEEVQQATLYLGQVATSLADEPKLIKIFIGPFHKMHLILYSPGKIPPPWPPSSYTLPGSNLRIWISYHRLHILAAPFTSKFVEPIAVNICALFSHYPNLPGAGYFPRRFCLHFLIFGQ